MPTKPEPTLSELAKRTQNGLVRALTDSRSLMLPRELREAIGDLSQLLPRLAARVEQLEAERAHG